jgi:hypothetical protein
MTTKAYNRSFVVIPEEPRYQSDLLEFPNHENVAIINEDVVDGQSYEVSHLHRFSLNNNDELTFIDSTLITFDSMTYLRFASYQNGLSSRYVNDNGDVLLVASVYLYQDNLTGYLDDVLNDYDSTFLGDEQTALYNEANPLLEDAVSYINNDFPGSATFVNVIAIFEGFYSFDTMQFHHTIASANATKNDMEGGFRYNVDILHSRFINDEGDMYLIQSKTYYKRPFGSFSIRDNSFEFVNSSLLSVDSVTNTRTTELSYIDVGITLNGVYFKEDGFYLTGNNHVTIATPDVTILDAFLLETDLSFQTTQSITLSGTGIDFSSHVGFNALGQPAWFVLSTSIDGDFLPFASQNPQEAFVQYIVSF